MNQLPLLLALLHLVLLFLLLLHLDSFGCLSVQSGPPPLVGLAPLFFLLALHFFGDPFWDLQLHQMNMLARPIYFAKGI